VPLLLVHRHTSLVVRCTGVHVHVAPVVGLGPGSMGLMAADAAVVLNMRLERVLVGASSKAIALHMVGPTGAAAVGYSAEAAPGQ